MNHRNSLLYAIIGLIIAVIVILVIIAALFTPTTTFWTPGQRMNMNSDWGRWIAVMTLGAVTVVILIILAIFLAVRPHAPHAPYYPPGPPQYSSSPQYQPGYRRMEPSRREALEILGQRYARGEISREEYIRMRDDLR
ncbi:MAG: SHOCT domain-containing protein [Methanomassiliicoccales archaeon]|jgi:uncharacterized membrane protein